MNNIFRILLLGSLPLAAFPVIQASAQEPDIQTLLSAERSSFISGKARDILCRKLGTANLDTDKIRAMAHAPQVALLCHLYQFFSAAENGEPFTQHELKDESFRKWLSTHPDPANRIRELQRDVAALQPVYQQARQAGRVPRCG